MNVRISRVVLETLRKRCEVSQVCGMSFFERDPKGGYQSIQSEGEDGKRSELWHIRNGLRMLGDELKLFKREVIEHLEDDRVFIYRKHEIDVVWQFDGNKKSLDRWVVTSDSDYGEGYSTSSLALTNFGRGLFSGYLDTRLPKTGEIKQSGYCNLKSIRPRKSFMRETYHNWQPYNHLVMRVRGDGRSYMLNISTSGYYDLTWNDMYHYALYTRGGPYWQYVKIPFSRFFMSSKGRVQDKQESIPLDNVVSFGITAADKVTGPFSLEIDYIGLLYDPNHTEQFAYEMYKTDDYVAGY